MGRRFRAPASQRGRRLTLLSLVLILALIGSGSLQRALAEAADTLHFLAIADSGGANASQQAVANRMAELHRRQPVDLVVMAGDNIYPDGNLARVESAFTRPYRVLLASGVPFHAALGNHDIRTANGDPQVGYPPFGMKGRWYVLRRGLWSSSSSIRTAMPAGSSSCPG
jgi:hypothetical protein